MAIQRQGVARAGSAKGRQGRRGTVRVYPLAERSRHAARHRRACAHHAGQSDRGRVGRRAGAESRTGGRRQSEDEACGQEIQVGPMQGASRMRGSARDGIGRAAAGAVLLCALALSGCADSLAGMSLPSLPKLDDINPFAEKPVPLPGKRISVIQQENVTANLAVADKPIGLPPPHLNDSWTQPGGVANNAPGHLALGGAVKSAWSANAGRGSSFFGKLTGSPIVYDGKVYTLDAGGKVSAFSTSGGAAVWQASVTPTGENDKEGFGGGLAADGGRIYAGTGYGYVVALDARSGNRLWEKFVGSPIRTSPTAAAERVFVLTKEGQVFCLSGSDGSELWKFSGMGERASLLSNTSPAVDGDVVVVPYPSGDLVALRVSDGQAIWTESLARTRTASSMAAMSDTARPVMEGGTVYAVGHAGRMVATKQKTGERLWSLTVPSLQAPWVAGDTVFVVDT